MGRYWVGSPGPGSAGECVTVLHVNWGFVNTVLTSHEIELQPNLDGHEFVWVGIRSMFSLLLIQLLVVQTAASLLLKQSKLSFFCLCLCVFSGWRRWAGM